MEAMITYTAGLSYRVQGVKFRRGQAVKVTSPKLIRYCQSTGGFNVAITKDAPKKTVRKVKRNESGEPVKAADAPAAKPRKRTRKTADA
jgi:hypothetical protein